MRLDFSPPSVVQKTFAIIAQFVTFYAPIAPSTRLMVKKNYTWSYG